MNRVVRASTASKTLSGASDVLSTPPKKTRSREGCYQCRQKKRKCDVMRPRCGACARGDSLCTFPPREWDPVEGRLVTVRQPNKRKNPPSNVPPGDGTASQTPVSPILTVPPSAGSSFIPQPTFAPAFPLPDDTPIDPALMNGTHDLFSFFTDPLGEISDFWHCPEAIQQESGDLFNVPNMLFDLGLPMTFPPDPDRMKANQVSIDTLLEMGNQTRPSTAGNLPQEQPERATVEEMKIFWQELTQLYDNINDHYFFSVSSSDRKKIAQTLITENFSDVHLAASAFLSAARRVLMFQHEGSTDKASEWGVRAMSFHRAGREMLADESFPLCSRIGAGIDFRLGHVGLELIELIQILQDDIVGAQALHEMNRSIVRQQLGHQPTWYLTQRIDNSTISLTTFITSDVLYALSHPGVKTAFDVRAAELPANADPGLRVHMGIPAEILSVVARIVNLAVDMDGAETSDWAERARDLESCLNAWKPEVRSGLSGPSLTETVAVQAMWCEVAKILLYQLIRRHGILSSATRSSLTDFLRTADMLSQGDVDSDQPRLFVPASRACAWFIASTAAISSAERAQCLKGLHGCGNEKAFRDNAAAAETLWTEMDQSGTAPQDWRQFLADKKMRLVFL